ncbi:hypothetical protein [Thalassotalea piscium]|uniref:Polysaccharide lyase family 7 protein n=1 Tax=Thalassotalea piscium TaxID=1230533 RepID=A0A7X0NG73_9GAMM|nr:hypothetical protein [Thalassotalea piscium]MBB6542753.1 hypothetical protein [Thalassotalea piscium]
MNNLYNPRLFAGERSVLFVGFISLVFAYLSFAKNDDSVWLLKSYSNDITYGGTVTKVSENSYRFESRTNPFCFPDQVRCNKALVSYKNYTKPVEGKIVTYSFDFLIEQYNYSNSPDWWVLFQDWIRIDPNNRSGNRPISTVEVKSYGNKLYLRHKDSAFQWGTDPSRTKQVNNGELLIQVGVTYRLRIELTEGTTFNTGGMALFVNDKEVSRAHYQTKSATQWRENVQEFGLYHDKTFNTERKLEDQIIFSINNLIRTEQKKE